MNELVIIKATSRVHMLKIRIRELEEEIKHCQENSLFEADTLGLMLRGEKKDLDIWNYILKLAHDEKKNNKGQG